MKPNSVNVLTGPLLAAVALAAATALGLSGCDEAVGKARAAAGNGAPPITAAIVLEQAVAESHAYTGRLEAVERVDIRARVGGYITSIHFKPGAEVSKGDVLFEIDARPFFAERDRAEAAANAARAKANLARLELKRAELLLDDKAIAQREVDEKTSSLKELDANASAAMAMLETARLNLAYTRVTAPIDGRASKAEITVGNLIDSSAVLTSVVSTRSIYASFDGDEDTYLRVGRLAQAGVPVTVKIGLANESGFPHEGKLEFVDNRLDPSTGSVRMRASFVNADRTLVPGLFARVQLGGDPGAQDKFILISERAIGTDQDRKYVFVVGADSKAEYRQISLGRSVDGLRIVQGLKAGEKIVVNGLQRVRPGVAVTAELVAMNDVHKQVNDAVDKAADKLAATSAVSKEQ